jgi:hypothetical protein
MGSCKQRVRKTWSTGEERISLLYCVVRDEHILDEETPDKVTFWQKLRNRVNLRST